MVDSAVIRVNLKPDERYLSYNITIGENLFPKVASYLRDAKLGSRYAIITDSNVRRLYAGELETCLNEAGFCVSTFSFPAGELNKTVYTCLDITGQMSRAGFGRDSVILALGGGVVGDNAGFISCVHNRGYPIVQIPTTVLAQADSSVGGKTGVDTEEGKNLWGGFKQPSAVFMDISTLRTLPDTEVSNGLAETIKHAVIGNSLFFEYLEDNMDLFFRRFDFDLKDLVFRDIAKYNCRIKAGVVQIDPDEKGLRKILNYGHTSGHAIEKLSNYTLSHGYSVSIGMMVAGRISRDLGFFPQEDLDRQERLLVKAGLPVKIPHEIKNKDIIDLTKIDKKAANGEARYCLPRVIGEMCEFDGAYATFVDDKIVLRALDETR